MPLPDLPVVAEGETPRGERWYLKSGGSPLDFYTMLRTVHPDGHSDEGGMGGPALYPGQLLNHYTGRAGDGPLRLIVRAAPRVRRLRIHQSPGVYSDLTPAAEDQDAGVVFFAALLPGIRAIDRVDAFDAAGQPLTG